MTVDEILPKNKKLKFDKLNNIEGRWITDEDYENDLRQKPVLIGLNITIKGVWGNQQNLRAIECYNYHRMKIVNREPVILNGERIAIVA